MGVFVLCVPNIYYATMDDGMNMIWYMVQHKITLARKNGVTLSILKLSLTHILWMDAYNTKIYIFAEEFNMSRYIR